MSDVLLRLARDRFGLDYLFPYQRLVITNILAAACGEEDTGDYGRQIVILPTGAGKSLCFQLPAAMLSGTTLVVYPLLSLMNDQARRMNEGGFSVVQLKGGQSAAERRTLLERIRSQSLDFIVTNPETLQNDTVRDALRTGGLIHAVIDEAHCISEWGDSFRPLYLTLGEALADLKVPIVTAFTATAGDHVLNRIREVLFQESGARVIRGNPDRENISYGVIPCLSRLHALRAIFQTTRAGGGEDGENISVWHPGDPIPLPAIVFCATRADTRWYASHLEKILGAGRAFHYHAGLDKDEKKKIEERFFHADDAVLCATCAYGMGVDKPNVRVVIHSYLPATAEAFLQESGRAGRDRRPAFSIVLIDPRDERRYRDAQMRNWDDAAGDIVTTVQRMAFEHGCRREVLLKAMGMEPEACSGCDRCEPDAPLVSSFPHETPVALFLRNLVARAPRRYTITEWIRLLRGAASWRDWFRGIPRRRGFGRLAHWREEDLKDALEQLVELGSLRAGSDRRLTVETYSTGRRQNGSPPTMPDTEKSASFTAAAARGKVSG